MKRGSRLRRHTQLRRGTPLKPVNERRKAKRLAKYRAYMQSAEWKIIRGIALKLAGYTCARCPETRRLTVHHKTYIRFGGQELQEDLEVLCKACHDQHHALEGKRIDTRRKAA